jgi:hypothetical protein
MVTSAVNNDGKTAFVLKGLESGMTVKVFLLDASYAPIDGYVPTEEVAK